MLKRLTRKWLARDSTVAAVMTPSPRTLRHTCHLSTAQEIMRENDYRHIPVTEKNKVIGIISDRDIKAFLAARRDTSASEISLTEMCLFEPFVIDEATPLRRVLDVMIEKKFGSAIVTSGGKCSGIFTTTDACRALRALIK